MTTRSGYAERSTVRLSTAMTGILSASPLARSANLLAGPQPDRSRFRENLAAHEVASALLSDRTRWPNLNGATNRTAVECLAVDAVPTTGRGATRHCSSPTATRVRAVRAPGTCSG